VVTITGETDTATYDGDDHSVSDYCWSANHSLYQESFFEAADITPAVRKDAGKADLILQGKFTNITANFTDVTFQITDGWQLIEKQPVILRVNDSSKEYGEEDPTFSSTVTGMVAGESLQGVSYSRSNSAENNAGTYTGVLTATCPAEQNPNYAVTIQNGKFTINASNALTVSGTNYSDIYDGETHGAAAVASVAVGTTIRYSTDNGTTWSTTVPKIRNVGTINVKVEARNPNYVTASASYTLEVTRKAVTVSTTNREKTYGDPDPDLTTRVTVDGTLNGDSISWSVGRVPGEDAGTYAITPAGVEQQGNYQVSFVPAVFTIHPKLVTLSWIGDTFTYNGEYKAVTATVTNPVSWDGTPDEVTAGSYLNASKQDAGAYTASVATLSGANASNYTLVGADTNSHNWKIEQAEQEITASDTTVTYDGQPHGITATTSGDGALSYTGNGQRNVGEYPVTITAAETQNYKSATHTVTLKIEARAAENMNPGAPGNTPAEDISVTLPDNAVYTGSSIMPQLSVRNQLGTSGVLLTPGEDYTVRYENNVNAGVETAVAVIEFRNNYKGVIRKAFTIQPRPVVLQWSPDSLIYNGTEQSVLATVGNAVAGDEVLIDQYQGNTGLNATDYTAEARHLTGAQSGNYTLTGATNLSHDWSVGRAPITLRAQDKTSVTGAALSPLTYIISAGTLYGTDTLGTVNLDTTAVDQTAGQYPITISIEPGTENSNYLVRLEPGTYTVSSPVAPPPPWPTPSDDSNPSDDPNPSDYPNPSDGPNPSRDPGLSDEPDSTPADGPVTPVQPVFPAAPVAPDRDPEAAPPTTSGSDSGFTEPEETPNEPTTMPTEPVTPPDNGDSGNGGGDGCAWHWLIVLSDLVYALVLFLTMKSREYETGEDLDGRKKKSRKRRGFSDALQVLILLVINYFGSCWWELPLSVISLALISGLMVFTYRRKFRIKEKKS
jgi:hypothetical protein